MSFSSSKSLNYKYEQKITIYHQHKARQKVSRVKYTDIALRYISCAMGRVVRYVRAELSATGRAVHGPSCPEI